jgi:hypothetical protein
MSSRFDHAVEVTVDSVALAIVPIVATLLSGSEIARILSAGPGGGIAFPFPTGLPTLWTYVSVPGVAAIGSGGGPLTITAFVPLYVLGLVITAVLEAGFLGSLSQRLDGEAGGFVESVERFTLRMVGVNLLRTALVLAIVPFLVFPPLALVVVLGLTYLVYGLPFEIVVRDVAFMTALEAAVSRAFDGGLYATFGLAHLIAGAVGSAVLTVVVRTGGLPGILIATLVIAVPAVFVAVYGLLVFGDLAANETGDVAV